MRIRLKGLNSITKTLADGSKRTYYYAWKGGPPLLGEPGTPEFIHSYNQAIARKIEPPSGVLLALLSRFQKSGEFKYSISARTQRDYIKQIRRIDAPSAISRLRRSPTRARGRYSSNGAINWHRRHCGKRITPTASWRAFCLGRTTEH